MRYAALILLLFCSYDHIFCQLPDSTQIENLRLSEDLLRQAGYAYVFSDYETALELYLKAQTLDPKNESIELLIEIARKEIENQQRKGMESEFRNIESALKILEQEAKVFNQKILEISMDNKKRKTEVEKLRFYNSLYINLLSTGKTECSPVLVILDLYTEENSFLLDFEFKKNVQEAALFLGQKSCPVRPIYSRKYKLLGDQVPDLRLKIENYITALNYESTFAPAFQKLKQYSLPESSEIIRSQIIERKMIDIDDNPVMWNYRVFKSYRPEELDQLYLSKQKELKKLNRLPIRILAGTIIPGSIAVGLLSYEDTRELFNENQNGQEKLSDAGKIIDYVGWGLLYASIPSALISIPLSKNKKDELKKRMDYINLYRF